MIPVTFPESNIVYTKPKGWTDEECSDLPAWEGPVLDGNGKPNGQTTVVSFWKFNKEDLENIQKTGGIYLCITGAGMVPACLTTENPIITWNPDDEEEPAAGSELPDE